MPKYRCTGRYTVHTKALRTGEVGSNNSECSVMQCKASQSDILIKEDFICLMPKYRCTGRYTAYMRVLLITTERNVKI